MLTNIRIFKDGNSQAALFPAVLAYARSDLDLKTKAPGITLVTDNIKDFERYPGVVLENWLH
ncbi:MAG: hypothetical protein Fur007_01950 [Rhodoferax sp.]